MALTSCNVSKSIFGLNEEDVSTIHRDQTIQKLPEPSISDSGDRLKYEFKENVEVDG